MGVSRGIGGVMKERREQLLEAIESIYEGLASREFLCGFVAGGEWADANPPKFEIHVEAPLDINQKPKWFVETVDWKSLAAELAAALEKLSSKRDLIIFAEDEHHVMDFMKPVDEVLVRYRSAVEEEK